MASITDHLDEFGFVISTEPDIASRGGNSAQHSAIYYIVNNLNFVGIWNALDIDREPRLYRDSRYWTSQRGHMSRDNLTCCVCALKLNKLYIDLGSLFWRIFKRVGFMWNRKNIGSDDVNTKYITILGRKFKFAHMDWCGFLMWFVATRFKYNPLNIVSDLYLFVAIYSQLEKTARDKDATDGHLNLIIIAETCSRISSNSFLNRFLSGTKILMSHNTRPRIILIESIVHHFILI